MEQRPLRLGDIVDDYCPRERRITNHAIVAIVENTIRQTRCTTCDAEHVYKAAKVPRRKKKDEPAALYEQVLTDVTGAGTPDLAEAEVADADVVLSADANGSPPDADDHVEAEAETNGMASDSPPEEAWSGHRPLIRATLPRQDGEPPPPRPIPEFTMHQRPGRSRGFRPAWQGQGGNGFSRNGGRPDRSGQGAGHGRHGHGARRRHGGRKKNSR